jgi:hypothetical protein
MHHRVFLLGSLFLSACGQRLAAPAKGSTSASPDETFECVKNQMAALGFKQSSVDADEHRVTATKIDMKTRRSDTQFRRLLDRLEVEVAAAADGQTSIDVRGHTFAEYTTQRGPTEVEEKPSADVNAASQELLSRCRS